MNWALFAGGVSLVLLLAWLWTLMRSRRSGASIYVSLGFLLLAGMNAAAPVRGLVDPTYVGYGVGFLHADRGLSVTLIAGAVFASAAAACLIAARNKPGPIMWVVSVTSFVFLGRIGAPWLLDVMADPSKNAIQFGEYLTIPGVVSSLLLALLLVGPFLVGALWAARRAIEGQGAPSLAR